MNSKWIIDLNVRVKIIKLLEGKKKIFVVLNQAKISSKAQSKKEKNW